jgi:transposase
MRRAPFLTREVLEAAFAAGQSRTELARVLDLNQSYISHACRKFGIDLPRKDGRGRPPGLTKEPGAREFRMRALYTNGHTLEQIGQIYGVTRERVRQILNKHFGITASNGGQRVITERAAMRRREKRDAAALARWGCTWAEYVALRDMSADSPGRRPTRAFGLQKRNAHERGIGWELNLAQWWAIWQSSGKWSERGRGNGYVMCRKGDEGPYAIGNVFIATARQNSSDQKRKSSGLPMGVSKKANCASFIAHRMIGGKKTYLGSFPTPELAHAAYLAAVDPPPARSAA